MEAKAWQAFYATLLLERSKFGLNELLGPNQLADRVPDKQEAEGKPNNCAEHSANRPGQRASNAEPAWPYQPMVQKLRANKNCQKREAKIAYENGAHK